MSAASGNPANTLDHLRRLYFVRFGFAVVWAATFAVVGSSLTAGSITLLVLYPVFDLAAVAFDARTSRSPVLYLNLAMSAAAAIGLGIAAADDMPSVLRVWGVWAILSGLAQLLVALRRRGLGGQWAMILSGSISALAGLSFLSRAGSATSLRLCAGYAALGGLFFLISAVRLSPAGHAPTGNAAELAEAR